MSNEGMSFYNFAKVLSFNAYWYFIIGARGLGKTFGAKKLAIRKFIKNGDQFVYTRRYKDELAVSASTFFDDIAHHFPGYVFKTDGKHAYIAEAPADPDGKPNWKIAGFFIPLSVAQTRKSVAYPKVKTIIFDEFIIEKGMTRYLPNEVHAFLNLYSTVDRNRGETRVLFLANAVSIMNPYFLYYDIKPDQIGEITTFRNGFICCHFAESADFKNEVYQTAFGQFIKGTEYDNYATGNEFSDAHDTQVAGKTSEATYFCTIETTKGTFSVWIDRTKAQQEFYIQQKRPAGNESFYTMIPEKVGVGRRYMDRSAKILQYLRAGFSRGRVWFDSPQSRNAMIEIFKR